MASLIPRLRIPWSGNETTWLASYPDLGFPGLGMMLYVILDLCSISLDRRLEALHQCSSQHQVKDCLGIS